ncbi:MAG: hypothetical protein E7Z97_08265 [Propionibacteriaceae bacterium]|nr:hypothetical protein [Propionibacteriaceae bacterium]
MSIQAVQEAADRVAEAKAVHDERVRELQAEMRAATEAGVPVAAVARAAGVSRQTAINWLKDKR